MARRRLLTGLAAAPFLAAFHRLPDSPADGLRAVVQPKGAVFGAAIRIDQIDADPELQRAALADCQRVTAEIHMKWDAIEPHAGRCVFGPADDLARFARLHGLDLRGHTLLWDQSTPAWAKAQLRERKDWSLVRGHIRRMGERYGQAVSVWDVVNEPIDTEHGRGGLRRNVFFEACGATYVERALRDARSSAPKARLAINEYGFDYDNPVEADRRLAFLRLVERLRRADVPLDNVGIQAHLDLAKGPLKPTILAPFLKDLADFGLDIDITELDVREHDVSAPIAVRDQRVADEVRAYLEIALDQRAVKSVTTWGLSDRHSWLQTPDAAGDRLNRGLPYDAALQRKPMYWTLRDALAASGRTRAHA